jgi:vanillate O-demethylase monooxygenase subunit
MILEPLRPYWYPVALSSEVRDKAVASQLLGERIAVYRGASGKVSVFRDLCIHRGTPLSLGWIDGEDLVCAYHGWSYGPSGACTRIPSLPPGRPIPPKARVTAYRAEERYGLVWACLADPRAAVPPYPPAEDPAYRTVWMRFRLKASAPRVIENVMDFAHYPWVHPGVLGYREKPVYPDAAVRVGDGRIDYTVDDEAMNAVLEYSVSLPLALQLTVRGTGTATGEVKALFFAASPVTDRETTFYFGYAQNYGLDQPEGSWARFNTSIIEQDRPIVESQRPELLPVDLSAELHLRGSDAPAVEYRRALARLGIESPREPAA